MLEDFLNAYESYEIQEFEQEIDNIKNKIKLTESRIELIKKASLPSTKNLLLLEKNAKIQLENLLEEYQENLNGIKKSRNINQYEAKKIDEINKIFIDKFPFYGDEKKYYTFVKLASKFRRKKDL